MTSRHGERVWKGLVKSSWVACRAGGTGGFWAVAAEAASKTASVANRSYSRGAMWWLAGVA